MPQTPTPPNQTSDQPDATPPSPNVNRRRALLAGAGVAGAVLVTRTGTAAAADGDTVMVGQQHSGDTATSFENTTTTAAIAGSANALIGKIDQAGNGSHAILGTTNGDGHAVAGVNFKTDNGRAATWGRHLGAGPGAEGQNLATNVPLAGDANGVLGSITEVTNGSHAVKGVTMGAGHSIAGDTPAEAEDGSGGPNTTAATWGRHGGVGAGIGGVSASGYGGEFVGGKAPVRLIPTSGAGAGAPSGGGHLVGELWVDANGDLFYNKADGDNFTKLNNQSSAGGTVLLSDPERAFDSRAGEAPANANKGRFSAGEVRSIDLTEFTALPSGATGAMITVTAVGTADRGYLTVFNGDTADGDRPLATSLNWSSSGDVVANSTTVALGSGGMVKVYAHRATDVVIDVIGYLS